MTRFVKKIPQFLSYFASRWCWVMAWRDSRRSRGKLVLFSTSIVMGIAIMVAIGSFGKNLETAIEAQSKTLLGADLEISSRNPFSDEQKKLLESLGGRQSWQISFSSMIYFPKSGGTRLVQVRALDGDFPYYGAFETEPPDGADRFRRGEGVLVEESLMLQFDAQVGDDVKIGERTLEIVGTLRKVPGENMVFATLAPRVYLPMEYLESTGLVGEASLARYKVFYQFEDASRLREAMQTIRPHMRENSWRDETVAERKQELGRAMENLYHFLNLVAFVALLLGGVGIASAIQIHIKRKLRSVAILRSIGGTVGQTFAVYLIQGASLGILGATLGASLGVLIQSLLPLVFRDFIPLEMTFSIQWSAVAQAAFLGFLVCVLFALLPLLQVRRVSPLGVFRTEVETARPAWKDPLAWIVHGLIVAGISFYAIANSDRTRDGIGFVIGFLSAVGVLYVAAKLVIWLAKAFTPAHWSYVWRQGMANLHRPNNRTLLMTLSLGLGTCLILAMYQVHHALIKELLPDSGVPRANMIMFDVQFDQKDAVVNLMHEQNLPVMDESPVVSMKIQSVKGESVQDLREERGRRRPRGWALRREYRSTFRDHLTDSEKLVAGEWVKSASLEDESVPISLEQGIAEDLDVTLGDEIVFDVQGIPITTRVASLREVEWRRVRGNFFVVFPTGVLEDAPGFYILSTRANSSEASARLQRAVVRQFPNVSIIDLRLILQVLDGLLSKIKLAIQFMALFTIITGIVLLISTVLTSKFQRIRECVLLRTLGASRKQILQILFVEYLLLGLCSSFCGIALAVGASWALTSFVFEIGLSLTLLPLIVTVVLNSTLTLITGLASSRGIASHPPLAILSAEG